MKVSTKLAVTGNGDVGIRAEPPLIVPIADLVGHRDARRLKLGARGLLESYRRSMPEERRRLRERFRYADMARKVVGVGSVGTRCWGDIAPRTRLERSPFLQAKEARRSVLERFAGRSRFANQGQRVVERQRLMQAASDIFLGWAAVWLQAAVTELRRQEKSASEEDRNVRQRGNRR